MNIFDRKNHKNRMTDTEKPFLCGIKELSAATVVVCPSTEMRSAIPAAGQRLEIDTRARVA
jgi:hypothetical protein